MPLTFTKFPTLHRRAGRRRRGAERRSVDWEVELVAVIGRRAHQRRDADGWDHVAGAHGRPGPLRARRADGRLAAAVQPRQVVPGLRPDRAVAGHARRARRPRRPRDRLRRQRRDDAGRPHVLDALRRRARSSQRLSRDLPAAARRPDLHRHARRASATAWTRRATSQPGDELVSTIEGIGSITTRVHRVSWLGLEGRRVVVAGGAGGFGSAITRRVPRAGRAHGGDRRRRRRRTSRPTCATPDAARAAMARGRRAARRASTSSSTAVGINRRKPIEEYSDADWDDIVAINLTSAFHTARAALPRDARAGLRADRVLLDRSPAAAATSTTGRTPRPRARSTSSCG